jgi:HSP20 family protein
MAMLTQYDALRNTVPLLSAMDRLFQDSFVRPLGWTGPGVPLDVEETGDTYVVTASLPGWKPEDVNLSIQGQTLTISGEYKDAEPAEQSNKTYHLRERAFASFSRSTTFALPVDADQAQAAYENGILTLTLPKAESAKPRVIKIGGQPDQKKIAASTR